MTRFADLSAKDQAAVKAALGGKPAQGSRAGRREAKGAGQWRCDGVLFDSYGRAEAHADRVGSHRIEVVLVEL